MSPVVKAFFDRPTYTYSYVVHCPETKHCAIIDSVLDFDYASGKTSFNMADQLLAYIADHDLTTDLILETHVHADHLSAAPYLKEKTGAKLAIGCGITTVQDVFGKAFNAGTEFQRDGSQFDVLLEDNQEFNIGSIQCKALHTPGHTPACMSYVVGDAVFVGDTLFMPDFGTARCDFPGGDAAVLFQSIQRLYELPESTRMFMCHDYGAPGREEFKNETTVGEEKRSNIHVNINTSQEAFVEMRSSRDATLDMPRLILPSVQVNMRAGHMPPAEDNNTVYLKIPVNLF